MTRARILSVEVDSPAYDAGFEEGCYITSVDGMPVRDVLDWQWLTDGSSIELGYIDLDGDDGTVVLERDFGEGWGIQFDGAIFDSVKTCRNACTFCFMRQLPEGMRPPLSVRDDDFRLSFLQGNFVTFTNLSDEDVERILEQRISPLRASLHAIDPNIRMKLMGKNAEKGLENLQRLLDGGIEIDAQIVLLPGENDGKVLDETLEWALSQPQIQTVGIVPLGFTKHQQVFDKSFDAPEDALVVISQIEEFQSRALKARGVPFAYPADEFYVNAYGEDVLDKIPDSSFYNDFAMFEDGIGITRSCADEFARAVATGAVSECADALTGSNIVGHYICGELMATYMPGLLGDSSLRGKLKALPVKNDFFGGNVNVTGLLCGADIVSAIEDVLDRQDFPKGVQPAFFIPSVIFNADEVTLDDMTLDDIKCALPAEIRPYVHMVSANPIDYIGEITELIKDI